MLKAVDDDSSFIQLVSLVSHSGSFLRDSLVLSHSDGYSFGVSSEHVQFQVKGRQPSLESLLRSLRRQGGEQCVWEELAVALSTPFAHPLQKHIPSTKYWGQVHRTKYPWNLILPLNIFFKRSSFSLLHIYLFQVQLFLPAIISKRQQGE